jgi:hypothetical protein
MKSDRSYKLSLLRFVLGIILCTGMSAVSEQPSVKPDSTQIYRDIESYSQKSKFARFMYPLIFKPIPSSIKKHRPKLPEIVYRKFEGKIIRNINIATLEPFGYSVNDTGFTPQNFLFSAGNSLHIRTRQSTVKNTILIRKNSLFDSLRVKESERLIRAQNYVAEVKFFIVPVDKSNDSVDVFIRELDNWSIIPGGSASTANTSFNLTENNFIGLGHGFQNQYTWNYSNGKKAFFTNYSIPNIQNSYVSALLHYNLDENNNFSKSLIIDRPFYSPLARWAAGSIIAQQFQLDTFADEQLRHVPQDLEFNTQDNWAGVAATIFKGTSEDARTTDAIAAGRYLRVRYLRKPDVSLDPLGRYSNEDFYLFGLGLSRRRYFKDNFIFNFGLIEDVPVGKTFGITSGYQLRNTIGRAYLGARLSFGDYFDWGYLSETLEYGTFFHGHSLEQGAFSVNANYFSALLKIGDWHVRQFIKPQLTLGLNRFLYDTLTINNENGIRGFSGLVGGTKKIVLTLQTQSYSPWNVFGFRFGPFLTCSLGMLGNANSGFSNSHVYSQLGIGALIRNEYLVATDFQLSLAFYPSIPGTGYDILKMNSFRTNDVGFTDFIFGKPVVAAFQ